VSIQPCAMREWRTGAGTPSSRVHGETAPSRDRPLQGQAMTESAMTRTQRPRRPRRRPPRCAFGCATARQDGSASDRTARKAEGVPLYFGYAASPTPRAAGGREGGSAPTERPKGRARGSGRSNCSAADGPVSRAIRLAECASLCVHSRSVPVGRIRSSWFLVSGSHSVCAPHCALSSAFASFAAFVFKSLCSTEFEHQAREECLGETARRG